MTPDTNIADNLITQFNNILSLIREEPNSGGKRRSIKGQSWEDLCFDIISNVIEAKNLPYTIHRRKTFTILGVPIEVDIAIMHNDNLIVALEIKDYGDSTQCRASSCSFKYLIQAYPNLDKCIFIRGHKGCTDDIVYAHFNCLDIVDKSKLYNFIPIKRINTNPTFVLDFDRVEIIRRVYELTAFLMETIV